VSSTAHLILARAFFGFDADKFGLSFDVACVGTLIAVLIYFRTDIRAVIVGLQFSKAIEEQWLYAVASS